MDIQVLPKFKTNHMENNRRTESVFIGTIIIVTLTLGIITNVTFEKITISSICFATSTTSLVYWFLGGIQEAGFNIGWLKLGGSMAALVGSFLVFNNELRKDFRPDIKPNVETIIAFDKTTAKPLTVEVLQGETKVATIDQGSIDLWADQKLILTDNLRIRKDSFYLGSLEYSQLTANNFFSTVEVSQQDAETFSFRGTKEEYSELLNVSVEALEFQEEKVGEYDVARLKFKVIIDDTDYSEINTIKNKQIKIIKVGQEYFLIAGLQAIYSNEGNFFQISIRPLNLK